MKIDTFIINNELHTLELRLQILDEVMDHFIIVESTIEHSGRTKPLHFNDNKQRFDNWKDKITYIIVEDTPNSGDDRWVRENFQRNAILRGLKNFKHQDLVFMSDIDEIPDPDAVRNNRIGGYRQVYSMYYINAICTTENWVGTTALRCSEYLRLGPQAIRNNRYNLPNIDPGGWHFAYMMSIEQMHHKLGAFAHIEYDTPQIHSAIEQKVTDLKDLFSAHTKPMEIVDISTGYFPDYLKTNQEKYSSFIK